MSGKRIEGTCHLCGVVGPLSFEHTPPRSAFNDRPVIEQEFFEAMQRDLDAPPKGRINQRGVGAFTLCESCNSKTGAWYADDFAEWCYQGMKVLVRSDFKPKLIYMHYIFPLRVIKQIYTMMFSINSERWRKRHPDLEAFVLDRTRQWLNSTYRAFVYYNFEGGIRTVGNQMAILNLRQGPNVLKVTEMTFPPSGYVVTTDGTCPDRRLYEITHFRRYGYDDLEVAPLYMPVLPTHLPIPLDYRSRAEIDEQEAQSRAEAARDRRDRHKESA